MFKKIKYLILTTTTIIALIIVARINNSMAIFNNVPIEKLESWKTIVQIFLVIFGAITIVFGAIQLKLESEIGKLQKLENDSLRLQIAKVGNSQAESNRLAQEANVKSNELEQQNLKLKIELNKTKDKTEIASRKAEEAKEATSPRDFSPDELAKKLRIIKNIEIKMACFSTPESERLFNIFAKTFRLIGWKIIDDQHVIGGSTAMPQGIFIGTSNKELAELFKNSLREFNIECRVGIKSELPLNILEISIGIKPFH